MSARGRSKTKLTDSFLMDAESDTETGGKNTSAQSSLADDEDDFASLQRATQRKLTAKSKHKSKTSSAHDEDSGDVARKRKTPLRRTGMEFDDEEDYGYSTKSNLDADEDNETKDETEQDQRLRQAKDYLTQLGVTVKDPAEHGSDEEYDPTAGLVDYGDAEDIFSNDAVGRKLKKHALRARGIEHRTPLAAAFFQGKEYDSSAVHIYRGPRLAPTCVCLTDDGATAYLGSKDSSIYSWDVETGTKRCINLGGPKSEFGRGHTGDVLCVSASSDGVYLASGGKDKVVRVWDVRMGKQICSFREHRDWVTGVAFRHDSLSLYSCSKDRTVNVYNMENRAFVETLYGHQYPVNGITALYQEQAYTCGADQTLRVWKIAKETQLKLKADNSVLSLDCIAALANDTLVTGSQDGCLQLWSTDKKKPVETMRQAHQGEWVSSCAALYASDVVLSGSCDGYLRIWQASIGGNKLKPLSRVPVPGYINGIAVARRARFAALAVGTEHRLGRWKPMNSARNGLAIVKLTDESPDVESDDEEELKSIDRTRMSHYDDANEDDFESIGESALGYRGLKQSVAEAEERSASHKKKSTLSSTKRVRIEGASSDSEDDGRI